MDFRTAIQLVRHLGPGWLGYRLWYAIIRKTGLLRRRAPKARWVDLSLSNVTASGAETDPGRLAEHLRAKSPFFFSAGDRPRFRPLFDQFDAEDEWTTSRLNELAEGRIRLFSGAPLQCGWPPRWHTNAMSGQGAPSTGHFSQISEFGFGDVKVIWELSRFGYAFDLVRIYWRTEDERCPAMFWQAVEDWRQHNPPNTGINWHCGQEAALRAFAWCFGMWGFMESTESTPERLAMLTTMLAVTGRRIEANINYGLSQKNNHGISEAAGLLTIGLLFPMLRDSARWERKGRRLLEKQARELIYDDGGFAQYSGNYHRVMLDDCVWAIRLAEIAGRPLSEEIVGRVVQAGRYLLEIQDRETGGVPRYGHDDGAIVLPLTNSSYGDYRPIVQAVAALDEHASLPYEPGPWNEKLLWLFGLESMSRDASAVNPGDGWKESGYGLLRCGDSFAFARGGRFLHRPSQADLLHVDIWWRGRNVAIDPGTYSYNATGQWGAIPFAGTACHNTVGVDGLDQARRVSRFLFLPWPDAPRQRLRRSAGGQIALLELEHDGYERLSDPVTHRRTVVQLGSEHWLIADELIADGHHDYRLNWLFADVPNEFHADLGRLTLMLGRTTPYTVQLLAPGEIRLSVVRAEADSPRGWHAPRYQQLAPALSLAARAHSNHFRFFSVLGPNDWHAALAEDLVHIRGEDWEAELQLASSKTVGAIEGIRWSGGVRDQLDLT